MNQNKRVLVRVGARVLTAEETEFVPGAIHATTQLCTAVGTSILNPGHGDVGCDGGESDS